MLMTLLGCPPPEYVPPSADDTGVQEVGLPSIKILFPNPGLGVDKSQPVCPNFTVVVEIDNFTLDPEAFSTDDVERFGHWHLHIDDPDLAMYVAVAGEPWVGFPGPAEEGPHTLYATLVGNSHRPLPDNLKGEDVALSEINVQDVEGCLGGGEPGEGYDSGR